MENNEKLRRYTTLPILLDMLANRHITLLDPSSWEDRNDSFFLETYRTKKKLKTLLALCFTMRGETFHHWKVFAGNASGVCVRFHGDRLLDCFNGKQGVRTGKVKYILTRDLKEKPPKPIELPFLKRKQYEDEKEFRILYESHDKTFSHKTFKLDLKSIDRIILSPWLPNPVFETLKSLIPNIARDSSIRVTHTGVIDYWLWREIVKNMP